MASLSFLRTSFRFSHFDAAKGLIVRRSKPATVARSQSTASQAKNEGPVSNTIDVTLRERNEKWDLFVGVCLERKPVITRELSELESKVQNLLQQLEFENSHKSDHELRLENENRASKKKDLDDDEVKVQLQTDIDEQYLEEFKRFQLAPRITEADKNNDTKSLDRALDRHLLLVTKIKLGDKHHWLLPHGQHKAGETLRESAERVIKEYFGDGLNVLLMGNAPCGFYKFKYPKPIRELPEKPKGAKVFFYKGQYRGGILKLNQALGTDFNWLKRTELKDFLPEKYLKSVDEFLLDES